MVSSYNKNGVGDTLIVMLKNSEKVEQSFERKGNIARIFNESTNETVGYNFFDVSELVNIEGNGQVFLSDQEIDSLNQTLAAAGFEEMLEADNRPKFVVGYVKECAPHPDSDHLNITQTEIDNDEVVQIVCGASNIAQGQKVVVAKVGAMMPNGMVIWDGELRGEASHGMICSARELKLENAPSEKGILVLPETAVTGEAFKG
ncbi:DUF4479 domain-containing protein [Desemzia sp. RIT804]|uniref:YtpR family tRNA-binding protein n=1 Tax=Desemzia sp. RIT 804 TaxID=2810209 RepID=UPI001950FD9C|nr:DUF4479 domain-containing protein [Desemzia sp. RIT 804]